MDDQGFKMTSVPDNKQQAKRDTFQDPLGSDKFVKQVNETKTRLDLEKR